jgi:hypothetical protein
MSVHLSRTEVLARARFVRAIEELLLDFDAESVGRIADDVGERGAGGDGDTRVDAVILECLRLIVDYHGRR